MPAIIKGPRPRIAHGVGSSVESSSIKTKPAKATKARSSVASVARKPKPKP